MSRPVGSLGRLLGVRGGLGEDLGAFQGRQNATWTAPGRSGDPQGASRIDFPWIFDGIGADNDTLRKGKVATMPLPQGACHNATMLVALATGTAELATLPFAVEELQRCHYHGEAATEGIRNEFGSVGMAFRFYFAICCNNVCGICHRQRATGNDIFLKLENCNDDTATGNWPRRGRLFDSSIYIYEYLIYGFPRGPPTLPPRQREGRDSVATRSNVRIH